MKILISVFSGTLLATSVYAATSSTTPPSLSNQSHTATQQQRYTPGLGEIMGGIQNRHSKLWFAGSQRNWPLANYELDELKESFSDAVTYHPQYKGKALADLLKGMTTQPLADLEQAIKNQSQQQFVQSFDNLSQMCNACHQANGYGFIHIQKPLSNPFANQKFATQ